MKEKLVLIENVLIGLGAQEISEYENKEEYRSVFKLENLFFRVSELFVKKKMMTVLEATDSFDCVTKDEMDICETFVNDINDFDLIEVINKCIEKYDKPVDVIFPVKVNNMSSLSVNVSILTSQFNKLINHEASVSFKENIELEKIYELVVDKAYDFMTHSIENDQAFVIHFLAGKYEFENAKKTIKKFFDIEAFYPIEK